jgi:hypothetical protein
MREVMLDYWHLNIEWLLHSMRSYLNAVTYYGIFEKKM